MKRRSRDYVGVQPNSPLKKKRKLEDQQDSSWQENVDFDNVDLQRRRTSSLVDEQVLEMLSDVHPLESDRLLEAGNEYVRPMPPNFQEILRQLREIGSLSEDTEHYYLSLGRGDSLRVPGEGGRKSFLEDVLRQDTQEAKNYKGGGNESEWKPVKQLGQGSFGTVILWEKTRRNGMVWLWYS